MRTTLDIADDVLLAAKELAKRNRTSAGQVLSDLARQALNQATAPGEATGAGGKTREFLGFRPFPSRGAVVTNDVVNRLREEDGD